MPGVIAMLPTHKFITSHSSLWSTSSQLLNRKHTTDDYLKKKQCFVLNYCQDNALSTNIRRYTSVFETFHSDSNNSFISSSPHPCSSSSSKCLITCMCNSSHNSATHSESLAVAAAMIRFRATTVSAGARQ